MLELEKNKQPGKENASGVNKQSQQGKGDKRQFPKASETMESSIPVLHYGASNNLDVFKKKLSLACMEKYKNWSRLIIDENYNEPLKVDDMLYDLKNDPYEINWGRLREAYKRRDEEIDDMRVDHTSRFYCLEAKQGESWWNTRSAKVDQAWSA